MEAFIKNTKLHMVPDILPPDNTVFAQPASLCLSFINGVCDQ